MVECPFCGSEVTEDLVMYGGTCPKCFAEIPGDEAPTDPGAEVRAQQERRDRRGRTLRIAVLFSLLVGLVTCTGAGALVAFLVPEPQVAELLDFDEIELYPPDLVGAPSGELGGTAPKKPNPSTAPGPKPDPAKAAPASQPTSASPRPRTGSSDIGGPADPVGTSVGGPKPPSVDLTISTPRASRDDNTILSDPRLIKDMIAERLRESIPRLQVCYDRRLKVDETLRGRWLLKFTVQTNGRVSGATASGIERQDRELEACIADDVEKNWRFGKISVSQPVQRTITLSN